MKKRLITVNTVAWFDKAIITPFGQPWLQQNPEWEIQNITDDTLLLEALANNGPTKEVIRRMIKYFESAILAGADVIMSTCTTMGPATRAFRLMSDFPLFNIDEPMAKTAVAKGGRIGVLATVPTSAPATRQLLGLEAEKAGTKIEIKTVINQEAFKKLTSGDVAGHDELVMAELSKLQEEVDVIALGQISLSQIKFNGKVPVFQVGQSGFEEVTRMLK